MKIENIKENIAITSDHAGYQLKEKIKIDLENIGYGVLDLGTNSERSVDYPDYGKAIALNILEGKVKRGIALCGTGIGISISANRFKGIRAALCKDHLMAQQARKHNNANILAIGARHMNYENAIKCVEVFLNTDFEGDRHLNRVKKMKMINNRSKFNQFAFHLSNPLTVFFRNIFLKNLVKNSKFLESYLGKIYRN